MDLRHLKFWNPAPSHLKLLPLKLTSLSFFRPNLNSSDEKEHPGNSIHLSPEGRQRGAPENCAPRITSDLRLVIFAKALSPKRKANSSRGHIYEATQRIIILTNV